MPDRHFLRTRSPILILAIGLLAPVFALSLPTPTYATIQAVGTDTPAAADTETEIPTGTPTPTETPTSSAVQIVSVQPARVGNGAESAITVTGSGFVSGAVVVLKNYSTLATTTVSATVLTAIVPAGVKAGRYDVRVINPDSSTATLADALAVTHQSTTAKATKTPKPTTYARPLITVVSYSSSAASAYPGQDVSFDIVLQNTGELAARDVSVTFTGDDLIPRETGGLISLGDLGSGDSASFSQPMRVSGSLSGYDAVTTLDIRYFDKYGGDYSDTSVLGLKAKQYSATPTPGPTLAVLSQLSLTNYQTTPSTLTPGTTFTLDMDVANVSSQLARQVVVSLGVGDTDSDVVALQNSGSTRFIEQLEPGSLSHLTFNMVVSGSAEGQLVPLTLSLTYMDSGNTQQTQSENISLQVETEPFLLVHFLTAPTGPINVGDTADISVEVLNIGSSSLNISMIDVVSEDLTISDGSLYVGPLDNGTSGVIPAQATGISAGTATIEVVVHYLDDYQREKTVTRELTLEVEGLPTPTPSAQGANGSSGSDAPDAGSQTVLGRAVRVTLAFFGLTIRSGGGPQGGAAGAGGPAAPGGAAAVTPSP